MSMLLRAEGPERANVFARILEDGTLGLSSSTGALQMRLGLPQARLRLYRETLAAASSVRELILAVRSAAETATCLTLDQPVIEVAWTYPGSAKPGLRTTGGVAREIVNASRSSLLLVGYSVTVDPSLTGLAAQTIDAIARAAERGVTVTAVLHSEVNRLAVLQAWRSGVRPPAIFTWLPSADDNKASVHAKLLIADRQDGLVTSANLTYHGLEGNLEMGLHVKGRPAAEIQDRIHDLIATGRLVPWM